MRFFVTSVGVDGAAALGGLAGADAHCQALAERVGAGQLTWRAYLSTSSDAGVAGVDARDRIGRGPWYNAKGALIARDIEELHTDRNGITRQTALTERGEIPKKAHDILTGSDENGRLARTDGVAATCANWTGSGEGVARVGHNDRMDSETFHNPRFKRWYGSWSSEHDTIGCGAAQLSRTGGAGQFYCFASDAFVPHRDEGAAPLRATYLRGLNVNHWIGDNLAATLLPNATYGATWFDEEDVRWIAAQGFDHVRVWVAGHRWVGTNGELDEAALAPFDDLLRWARDAKLGVVLAMHSTPGYRAGSRGDPPPADASSPFTDQATRGDAAYLWWLVARRYAREGDALRFELVVQPDAPDDMSIQTFNREALAAIRRTDRERMVYLTSHDDAHGAGLVDLSDPRTALSLRFWDPVVFTYQTDPRLPKVSFPSRAPDLRGRVEAGHPALRDAGTMLSETLVAERVERLARQSGGARSRPAYVAEFGVAKRADDVSAKRYLRAARTAFEAQGLGWAVYDYHTAFAVRDREGRATRILDGLSLGTEGDEVQPAPAAQSGVAPTSLQQRKPRW